MRALWVGLFLAFVSRGADAGENQYLGALTSSGSSVNNTTTAVPFGIPAGAKLTLYCDSANGRLLTDKPSTATSGATKGVPLPNANYFPTSVGSAKSSINGNPTALLAFISSSGTTNCDVWARSGDE